MPEPRDEENPLAADPDAPNDAAGAGATDPAAAVGSDRVRSPEQRPARRSRGSRPARSAAAVSASRALHRQRAVRGAVAATGLVLVAGAVLVPLVSLPDVTTAARGTEVTPPPAPGRLVCLGALIDPSDPDRLTPLEGAASAFWPDGVVSAPTALAEPDVAVGTGVAAVQVPAPEAGVVVPAGVTTQVVGSDTARGLSAGACREASADAWLVAGSTDVGRTSEIVLSNGSDVAATVDLAVYGESGPVEAAGASGIVVPPGSVHVVALAGLAPDIAQPVVRMTARGGEVAASLQSSVISGLTPQGVETSTAGAAPSSVVTIAGYTVQTPPQQAASDDGTGGAGGPVVRVLAPGDGDATVTVTVTNEDPAGTGTSTLAVLPASRVAEIPLEGLADGSYTVTLSSDRPIVAGGRTTTIGTTGTDYAWFASGAAAQSPFAVADAGGAPSVLHLANTADAAAQVSVEQGGTTQVVTIAPLAAATVPLAGPAVVTSDQPVQAAVTLAADGLLAAYPIVPPGPLAAPITIYTH